MSLIRCPQQNDNKEKQKLHSKDKMEGHNYLNQLKIFSMMFQWI
jgi:hypothetical protein